MDGGLFSAILTLNAFVLFLFKNAFDHWFSSNMDWTGLSRIDFAIQFFLLCFLAPSLIAGIFYLIIGVFVTDINFGLFVVFASAVVWLSVFLVAKRH